MRPQQAQQATRETRVDEHDIGTDRRGDTEASAVALDDENDPAFSPHESCNRLGCRALNSAEYD